jgi:hypothetical protein
MTEQGNNEALAIAPWRWTLLGVILLAAIAALYVYARPLYSPVLRLWAVDAFRYPFLDAEGYITPRQCFLRGIDVYVSDPCDVLGRLMGNSPFCLRFFLIPSDPKYTPAFAGAFISCYAWATTRLAPVTGRWAKTVFALGFFSPPVVFAIERGNLDLFIFALAMAMILLLERGKIARLLAYALSIFGFLLKFYPIMLILLAVKERPRLTALVAALTAGSIAAYIAVFHHELLLLLPNIANPGPFEYVIGAHVLSNGLGYFLRHTGYPLPPGLMATLMAVQILASLVFAVSLMRDNRFGGAVQALTLRETSGLLTGALLLCGCFFSGVSIGYRAIHMLFALPALIRMAKIWRGMEPAGSCWWRHADLLALALLWMPVALLIPRAAHLKLAANGAWMSRIFDVIWLCREIGWWVMITLLLAMILRLFSAMPCIVALRQALPWLDCSLPTLPVEAIPG